jgi:hypothetical protein
MWGYSGGALATEWAAELQVAYAPELNISGMALGGLTPNVFTVFQSVSGGVEAGLIPPGVVGLFTQYPSVKEYLESKLKPTGIYNASTFLSVVNLTVEQTIPLFANQDIFDYFIDGISDIESPIIQSVIDTDGIMGIHGTPAFPAFVYKAVQDEVSPVNETDALVAKYCSEGTSITYQRNLVGGHGQEQFAGSPYAFAYLTGLLNGTSLSPGCTTTNVTIGSPNVPPYARRDGEHSYFTSI